MGVIVRAARAADEAAWRGLWAQYCTFYRTQVPEAVTAATWRRVCDTGAPILGRMAERDGALVGFALAVLHEGTWTLAPCCYLEDLFVAPEARGGGIGAALMDDLCALGRREGWSRLYWHTEADNAAARRLYDRYTGADGYVRYRLVLP